MAAFATLVRQSALPPRYDRGHPALNRARGGDRNFLLIPAAVEPQNPALDRCRVALREQQDRGRHQRPVTRSDSAFHARDLPLGIQTRFLVDARSAATTASPGGTRLSQLRALGDPLFRRPPAPHRLSHDWIAVGSGRLLRLPQADYEASGQALAGLGPEIFATTARELHHRVEALTAVLTTEAGDI